MANDNNNPDSSAENVLNPANNNVNENNMNVTTDSTPSNPRITWPQQYITRDGVVTLNPEFEVYEEQDGALASWLLSTVSEELLPHLIGQNTDIDIWNTLHQLYSGKTTSRLMSYRRMLHSQKKGDLSMQDFLMKIKLLCDNLDSCGEVISEYEHITTILNGLPPEYEPVVTVITASPTPSDLRSVRTILLDADARQTHVLSQFTTCAHLTTQTPSSNKQQNTQLTANPSVQNADNTLSHNTGYVNNMVQSKNNTGYTYGGAQSGHSGNNSPYRGRGRNRYNSNRPQCQLCGRLGHIVEKCYHRFDMSFKNETSRPVQANVCSYTDVLVSYNVPYASASYQQHAPSFANLSHGYTPYHTQYSPQISQPRPQPMPSVGVRPFLNSSQGHPQVVSQSQAQFNSTPSQVPSQAFIATPDVLDDNSWFFQFSALFAKSHKLPFTDSHTVYSQPLELVVADVWGPAPLYSNGFLYYVAFTDAYSRYTWFSTKLKVLQTDGGGEFRKLDSVLKVSSWDVSTRDNGSGLGRFSWLIKTSAERLAELLAYV
ncbi:hypothetical protein GQ457_08G017820 [Hibiscus cannabinus]